MFELNIKTVEKSEITKTLRSNRKSIVVDNERLNKETIPFSNKIQYGICDTQYGTTLIGSICGMVCAIYFCGNTPTNEIEGYFFKCFKGFHFERNDKLILKQSYSIFQNTDNTGNKIAKSHDEPTFTTVINLLLIGTDFQIRVWKALTSIKSGETCSYKDVFKRAFADTQDIFDNNSGLAIRAVANAIGKNPISYLVPCHRVIRSDGSIGGYRWGIAIKEKILTDEIIK